jgi:hypothetical protein
MRNTLAADVASIEETPMLWLPTRLRGAGLLAPVLALFIIVVAGPAAAQTPGVIGADSPVVAIGPANPVVTVPVTLSRDDTTAVLGFSVQIQLSAEFTALTLPGDITLGNFLTDGGRATNLQVISNGGGSYTVDGVTLGASCGPTEQTGTLFGIALLSAAASATGTVTIQSVTLRDCDNQTLSVTTGDTALVTIDNTAPVVDVTSPDGGETWVYQTVRNITWSATDAAGVASVALEVSTDNGGNWSSIATGEANDGTYAWNVPNTPTTQGLVRVTALDVNGNQAADTSAAVFTILSNSAPVLTAIGAQSVDEGSLLSFTATATDGEAPPQTLSFSLAGTVPAGALITTGGAFTWTPTEAQGPGLYTFDVVVTDDGTPNLTDSVTVAVTVNEVNLAPALSDVPSAATIPELVAYAFDANATDADLPAQTLTFSLVGAPAGAAIDPGVYPFTVRVSDGVASTDSAITLTVDEVTIGVIADLVSSRIDTGNDGDGTMQVQITWSGVAPTDSTLLYRAPYGGYPEYDDSTGTAPSVPAFPPPSPWQPVGTVLANAGLTDEPATRDFWTYVAFVRGAGDNYSAASNLTAGTLNYLLGDFSDGVTEGQGDNTVNTSDISLIGAGYGLTGAAVEPYHYLDVGPTTDLSVNSRPMTDNAINFEDLVMLAINYGTGPQPQLAAGGVVATFAAADRLTIEAPERVTAGQEFLVRLRFEGTGRAQALSAALRWQEGVVEPVAVEAGEWLSQQGGVAFSPRPGVADVALLGVRGAGFGGDGELVVVRFRALAAGEPKVALAAVVARDAANRDVSFESSSRIETAARPAVTLLAPAYPNPFGTSATIEFSLSDPGPITLAVYGVDGRRIRTLADGLWEPGVHRLEWNGQDDEGDRAATGIYFVQLSTRQGRFTKRVTHLR